MKILTQYIKKSFFITFLSIFLPLFFIASIVFLIKLATYTAIIQLSLWEMITLFLFMVPELFFYTLPISFFVAATLTLFKLSNDNEIVVIFSLGIEPKTILKVFLFPAALLSATLIFNFYMIYPHIKILSKNFLSYKKSEAKFNLSASEFGHKFGNWLLYINKENKDKSHSDVVLFNKSETKDEIFVKAKKAFVINDSGVLKLKLISGEGYNYSKDKFTQVNFETMFINDTMDNQQRVYQTPLEYWLSKENRKMLITNSILSFFPLLTLFLIASIGIVHVRHQKGKVYLYLFLSVLLYYGLALGFQEIVGAYSVPIILISWFITTYFIYKRTIVAKF